MLISLPFLRGTTSEDVDKGNTLGELAGQGAFPLSYEFGWHGGIHLEAPGGRDNPEPVRAIADGTVVYARASDEIPDHDADAAIKAAHPLLYYTGWTSNGVVILQHDTEIGEGVRVIFYSVYQHLHTLTTRTITTQQKDAKGKTHTTTEEQALKAGDTVYRKDALGTAGAIYGKPHRIHLEILADEANVAALMGRARGPLTATQGRTTAVWGDTHITVPAGTPYYANDPREMSLTYTVRLFDTANPRGNDTLASVAAQFATTPETLRQRNAALIADLRKRYPRLGDEWFSALNGTYQHMFNLPAPTAPERTLSVPPLWGDSACPPHIPTEVWATWQAPVQGRTAAPLIVSSNENGANLTLTTRDASGKPQGAAAAESSYDLYTQATKQFPGCASAGYELLRFGRVLGPDALAASDQYRGHVPHLRKVRINGNDVFMDLNVPGVRIYSDADFPDWQGWTFIDDDTDGNSRCDSPQLINLILAQLPPESVASTQDAQAAPVATPPTAEEQARRQQRQRLLRAFGGINNANVRERLKRCVVKMPTEWARDDFDTRWNWVKNTPGDLPANVLLSACLTDEAYERFRRHHSALAFWEDAKEKGLQLDKVHYHLHPKVFIETFKKCGWLSERELTQLLPKTVMWKGKEGWLSGSVPVDDHVKKNIQNNRIELNKALRKFSIAPSPLRMAAFFGNATEETQWFQKLYEDNKTARYRPWDGRGFLQLTGPGNYFKYWEFRGRRFDKALKDEMDDAHKKASHANSNEALQDGKHPGLTEEILGWRKDVIGDSKPFDASNSAGAYWSWTHAVELADREPLLKREIQIVNNVVHVYYSCESFGLVAAVVNFGSAPKDTSQVANVNGIVARYQAYTNALVVLDDYRLFPYTEGHQEETPEGFERRTL